MNEMTTTLRPIVNLAVFVWFLLPGTTAAFGAEPNPPVEVLEPTPVGADWHALKGRVECVSKDKVLARELFNAGVSKIEDNDWQAGCSEVAAGLQLHCSPSALFYMAKCLANQQRLLVARQLDEQALELLEQRGTKTADAAKLRADLKQALDAITERIPRLRVVAVPSDAEPSIVVDGNVTPANAPVAVDPGAHEVTITAEGYAAQRRTVLAVEGTEHSIGIALSRPASTLNASSSPLTRVNRAETKNHLSTRRQVAVGMAAGGLLSFGVAGVLGIRTRALVKDARSGCSAGWVCGDRGYDLLTEAARTQNWAIGLTIVGVVGAGAGVLLWTTERSRNSERLAAAKLQLGFAPSALYVRGAW